MAKKREIKARRPVTIKLRDRIDVREGRIGYGQMVDLGRTVDAERERIANGEGHDDDFVKKILRVLHPNIDSAVTYDNVRYAYDVVEAVLFWKEQEYKRLKYEPTAEEKQAGFEKLAEVTGPRGVAVSIGKDFSTHPDDVFKWEYGSVFTVLEIDLERFKYNRRLNEIRDRKRKREDLNRRRARRH